MANTTAPPDMPARLRESLRKNGVLDALKV